MVAHTRPRVVQHKKRHGKHQKHTKGFLDVYWPYVPLLVIVATGLIFTSYWHPRIRSGVLAYATSMSSGALLSATNQQRGNTGAGSLTINAQLTAAAQAKANDMAARNYWAHNTPEGNPPWVFLDQAGYSYQKAGENLAYGFATSEDTIAGWMDSQSHRENMLNGEYTEVGFGFIDVSDYVSTGPETIVVAEYGQPLTSALPVATTAPTPPAPAPAQTKAAIQTAPVPAPEPQPEPVPVATVAIQQDTAKPAAVTTASVTNKEPPPKRISRLATITGGNLPWLTTFATITAIAGSALVLIKHGFAVRRWFVRGERYVLHHALFDITVLSLVGLCVIVSQTAGVIR